jgi:hypothetical protein
MTATCNPVPGLRVLPHERMQPYELGAHTLEVSEDPADPTARTIRITAAPESSDPDACDAVAEEVCLSWEEAYHLLMTLHALFCQEQQEDA